GSFVPNRVLGDLHQHRVAGRERLFDRARLTLQSTGVPVDLPGVEDRVATAPHIHERRFHTGQHVLDLAEVDAASHGRDARTADVVLHQDAVFQHRDLGPAGVAVAGLADHHHPLHRLTAGEELRLRQHRWPRAALVTPTAAALALRLQAGRAGDTSDLIGHLRLTDLDNGLDTVVGDHVGRFARALAPPPTTTSTHGPGVFGLDLLGSLVVGRDERLWLRRPLLGVFFGLMLLGGLSSRVGTSPPPAAPTPPAAARASGGGTLAYLVLTGLLSRFGRGLR